MAKIPFTLEAWLKDKSQKVETRDGRPARIICTDAKADDGACIIALIPGYGGEEAYQFFPDGRAFSSKSSDEDCTDLFIVTPEPELTPFEDGLRQVCEEAVTEAAVFPDRTSEDFAKAHSAKLLALAREQFIKDGYVIEKKAFHDAVDKVSPEVMEEVSENIQIIALCAEYEKGRADVLKDLPRWKKIGYGDNYSSEAKFTINGRYLEMNDTLNEVYEVPLSALEKLPTFKED